jgi:hypothetical protein
MPTQPSEAESSPPELVCRQGRVSQCRQSDGKPMLVRLKDEDRLSLDTRAEARRMDALLSDAFRGCPRARDDPQKKIDQKGQKSAAYISRETVKWLKVRLQVME